MVSALPESELAAELLHLVRVAQRGLQRIVERLVGLQRATQVGELRAQLEQLAQRLDLPRHGLGREVVEAAEVQLDAELRRVRLITQLVLDAELEARLH